MSLLATDVEKVDAATSRRRRGGEGRTRGRPSRGCVEAGEAGVEAVGARAGVAQGCGYGHGAPLQSWP